MDTNGVIIQPETVLVFCMSGVAAANAVVTVLSAAASELLMLSEEEDDALAEPVARKRRRTCDMTRNKNYVSEIVPNFTDREFQSHFRMNRGTFQWLLQIIRTDLTTRSGPGGVGRPIIDADKQLLSVLWLMATPDSFRSVADRFGMSKGSLHKCFRRVISALVTIAPRVVRWPNEQERQRISTHFYRKTGIDGIVGLIDGSYIKIKAPEDDPTSYVNRKCDYAMTMQAVCDENRRFTDVFTGYPSSVSDTRIFQNSDLCKRITREPRMFVTPHQFMLGDKAYETKTYCVPPYKKTSQFCEWQRRFNKLHASCRSTVERSFALFFGRLRRFRDLDMSRTDWIPATIIAGAVLHNICLIRPDDSRREFEIDGDEFLRRHPEVIGRRRRRGTEGGANQSDSSDDDDDAEGSYHSALNHDGKLFRDELAREMGLLRDRPPIRRPRPRQRPAERPQRRGRVSRDQWQTEMDLAQEEYMVDNPSEQYRNEDNRNVNNRNLNNSPVIL